MSPSRRDDPASERKRPGWEDARVRSWVQAARESTVRVDAGRWRDEAEFRLRERRKTEEFERWKAKVIARFIFVISAMTVVAFVAMAFRGEFAEDRDWNPIILVLIVSGGLGFVLGRALKRR